METEIRKDIKGREDLYQVSNLGKVKSLDRTIVNKRGITQRFVGRILATNKKRKSRYMIVALTSGKIVRHIAIQRLVAKHFLGVNSSDEKLIHINGDNTDNRACNLMIATCKEVRDKCLTKENSRAISVNQYTLDGKLVGTFWSVNQASTETKIAHQSIFEVIKGRRILAGGFMREYADKNFYQNN